MSLWLGKMMIKTWVWDIPWYTMFCGALKQIKRRGCWDWDEMNSCFVHGHRMHRAWMLMFIDRMHVCWWHKSKHKSRDVRKGELEYLCFFLNFSGIEAVSKAVHRIDQAKGLVCTWVSSLNGMVGFMKCELRYTRDTPTKFPLCQYRPACFVVFENYT